MGRTSFKRLLRSPEKKEARACASAAMPREADNIAIAEENSIASDAAEPSPDADRPKSSCPDVGSATVDGTDSGQSGMSTGEKSRQSDEDCAQSASAGGKAEVVVFTDKSVCHYLRVRRRVLAEARKASSRGVDWDAVGEEVGMTKAWIDDYAIKHGIVPNFAVPLERVSGKYVSARLVGTTPNQCICIAKIEATGTTTFARVRNLMSHPMHYQEVFDCLRIDAPGGGRLEWVSTPNDMPY